MSSAGQGYGEGFFYTPEDQAAQQAIRRRQAYAQALMQGKQHEGQFGGLADAGNSIAGALIGRKADKDYSALATKSQGAYASALANLLKGGSGPSPQISNSAGSPQELDPEGNPMAPRPGAPQLDPEGNTMPSQSAGQGQPQNFTSRLAASGNPALMFQFGPDAIRQQMQTDAQHVTPISAQDATAQGLRGIWGRNGAGNLVQIQASDVKSKEAEDQIVREQKLTPEETFMRQQQAAGVDLATAHRKWAQAGHVEDANGAGWTVVNGADGQPIRYNTRTAKATTLAGVPIDGPTGYSKIVTNNPRSAVGIYMEQWEKENPKASAADRMTAMNSFAGQQSEQKTLGGLGAKIGSANNGLDLVLKQSDEAYNKLGRGNFVPFNKLQQMAATNAFSSPEQADAYAADAGAINLWAKSINPSGVLTVENSRRGEQMLSQAQSPEAHHAVLERMRAEGAATKRGVDTSRGIAPPPVQTGLPPPPKKTVKFSDLP